MVNFTRWQSVDVHLSVDSGPYVSSLRKGRLSVCKNLDVTSDVGYGIHLAVRDTEMHRKKAYVFLTQSERDQLVNLLAPGKIEEIADLKQQIRSLKKMLEQTMTIFEGD